MGEPDQGREFIDVVRRQGYGELDRIGLWYSVFQGRTSLDVLDDPVKGIDLHQPLIGGTGGGVDGDIHRLYVHWPIMVSDSCGDRRCRW